MVRKGIPGSIFENLTEFDLLIDIVSIVYVICKHSFVCVCVREREREDANKEDVKGGKTNK